PCRWAARRCRASTTATAASPTDSSPSRDGHFRRAGGVSPLSLPPRDGRLRGLTPPARRDRLPTARAAPPARPARLAGPPALRARSVSEGRDSPLACASGL